VYFWYDARVLGASNSVEPTPAFPSDVLSELLPIVREINAVLDPDALLRTIAAQVRRIVNYSVMDIFLPDADGVLSARLVEGCDPKQLAHLRLRPGEGIVGTAALLREPLFVPDVSKDPRYIGVISGVATEMAIPLLNHDRLVGVLNVEGPDVEAFTADATAALRVLASHLAVAIENANLYREAKWYAGLLATLYEIGKETASILDLDELLHRVAEVVKRVIDYEMFGILLLDEERKELVLRKSVRFANFPVKRRIRVGEGLCGAAALFKEPILVGDVQKDPRYLNLIPETRSELVVPLIHKDRVVGVFDLESSVLNRFTEEHVKILTPLASQVAVAIENARLYQEIRVKERRVERELAIARQVQHGLFPEEHPHGRFWKASAHFSPARELGGDLYDFYELSENVLGLSLGDVAGKGVPAALYGAFASGTVRARVGHYDSPADLLARINRTLYRRRVEGMFCTLTYARFDFGSRTLRLANSGLPYPLHYRAAERKCSPIEVAGLPLGSFEGSTYEGREVALETGDVFVFHTDGVTEAHNGRESYGTARLMRLVEENAHLGNLGDKIIGDLGEGFMGNVVFEDDVTLLVVRVL
jgi:sigma-B regulation protein RsbU (phosphoserine phosphatase)